MSDQALAWKAAFGAVVLLFCAATWVTRTPSQASQQPLHGSSHVADAPAVPAEPAAATPRAPDPAPLDVQDDAPPVRVEITLNDPEPEPAPRARAPRSHEPRLRSSKMPAPRIHGVAARRKASPYAIGRTHYPYDPRERWALRDAP